MPLNPVYEDIETEFSALEAQLADPSLQADRDAYAVVARRYKALEAKAGCVRRLRALQDDIEVATEMLVQADAGEKNLLQTEIQQAQAAVEVVEVELAELLAPRDPNDGKNVIVEIKGAEGGEEANLFARDLCQMYQAYAAQNRWKLEMMSVQNSDMGGYTDVVFMLRGEDVWRKMKFEGGPHRVQRVPVTESQGRVHTSSATVSVLPEAEEVELHIDEKDLQVDVYRSSGPGGQSVNTTDSAVRVTHKPTGLVVSMQDEKSQLQNRNKAMAVLRARLLQAEKQRLQDELSEQRRDQVGGGGRSEKIRTYNFKENRVSDHRIGLTLYKLDRILAGDLDEVVEALAGAERPEISTSQ
ncbi:MAG: peptide chain release factor 1 [Acidimicrobiia bacterium]|nr:peptide chain release factor 1 [Acidimicrobiia bacterium]MYC57161.1 peptide chain release factor 1 [Acidimicrobiia bacterium]MYG93912.1 peptide chain release factor 1 [Acidimicrobiia bacterium]MYI29915.1 peptide chain release factor 1 [Acidimicrobiia bacterium]